MKLHQLALAAIVKADCAGNDNHLDCVTECSTDGDYAKVGRMLKPLYIGQGKSKSKKAKNDSSLRVLGVQGAWNREQR